MIIFQAGKNIKILLVAVMFTQTKSLCYELPICRAKYNLHNLGYHLFDFWCIISFSQKQQQRYLRKGYTLPVSVAANC